MREAVRRVLDRLILTDGLEEVFEGAGVDARTLRDVLAELARGRSGRWHGTLSRTARRGGLTPKFVADRAAILLAALDARRRDDLYRILGVPGLASLETLAERWQELSRTAHPWFGGDPERFRSAKEAWDTLRDPVRRAAYDRWWMRAIGPFEAAQARSTSMGGAREGGGPDAASAASAASVSASRARASSNESASAGMAASRARPSRSSVRAPRGLPCAR